MTFAVPKKIHIVGAAVADAVLKSNPWNDLCIEMPSSCFEKIDRSNFGYHDKRVLFLARVAKLIAEHGFGESVEIASDLMCGDKHKPVLLLRFPESQIQSNNQCFSLLFFFFFVFSKLVFFFSALVCRFEPWMQQASSHEIDASS